MMGSNNFAFAGWWRNEVANYSVKKSFGNCDELGSGRSKRAGTSGRLSQRRVNEDGVMLVHLPELKKGAYAYWLTAPGFEDVKDTLVADTGVMHRVDLILKPAVMAVEPSAAEKVS